MTTVIMMFILPIGIIIYFWDKKIEEQNREIFETFIEKIKNSDLQSKDKLLRIDEMYYKNGYTRIHIDENSLTQQKKHFNIGTLLISLGVGAYIGLFLYIMYYKLFLKPREIKITL